GDRSASRSLRLPPDRLEEQVQLGRQGRRETKRRSAGRMCELELRRVQEHALESALRQGTIELEIAVLVVARDRKPEVREMYAYLVGAAGHELRLEQRVPRHLA